MPFLYFLGALGQYMPEPNLPPLHIAIGPIERGCVSVNALQELIPELPEQTRTRLKALGLTTEQAIILVNEHSLLTLFEQTVSQRKVNSKLVANTLINDFLAFVNKEKMVLEELTINANNFGELTEMLDSEIINRNTARILLERLIRGHPDPPSKMVKDEDLAQINSEIEIEKLCVAIISENPKIVKQYKEGKAKLFNALMGIAATKSNQRANMKIVATMFKKLLDK